MDKNTHRKITILTGERQSGKTSLCRQIADLAKQKSLNAAGVVSPAVFKDDYKVGIDVVNLGSGISRPFAVRNPTPDPGALEYEFDESTTAWANEAIVSSIPCDLLVIDELGPLEILQNRGFVSALEVLRTGQYGQALVVVRPGLIDTFRSSLGLPFEIVTMEGFSTGPLSALTSLQETIDQLGQANVLGKSASISVLG